VQETSVAVGKQKTTVNSFHQSFSAPDCVTSIMIHVHNSVLQLTVLDKTTRHTSTDAHKKSPVTISSVDV